MRISACLIVKNEERCLARCLESLKTYVDEIIVVDTGSTDATVAIAQAYTEHVLHFKWLNDFGAARNFALDAATGDWVLSIDADEWLAPGTGERLRPVCAGADPQTICFNVSVKNLELSGEQHHITAGTRLFRRASHIRWVGRIHETIIDKTGVRRPVHLVDLMLVHDGYLSQVRADKGKSERNLEMLLQEFHRQPRADLAGYISNEYRALNEWGNTATWARTCVNISGKTSISPALLSRSYENLALALDRMGQHGAARRYAQRGLRRFPQFTDLQLVIGGSYMGEERWEDAIVALDQCVAMGAVDKHVFWTLDGVSSFMPHTAMGTARAALCQSAAAVTHYVAALAINPQEETALAGLVRLLIKHEGGAAALEFVQRRLGLDIKTARLLTGVFLRAGALPQADACHALCAGMNHVLDAPSAAMWELYHGRYPEAAEQYAALSDSGEGFAAQATLASLLARDGAGLAPRGATSAAWQAVIEAVTAVLQGKRATSLPVDATGALLALVKAALALPQEMAEAVMPVLDALFELAQACAEPLTLKIGQALLEADSLEAALPYLHKAALESPERAGVLGAFATGLERRGQVREAAACFNRAAELAPGTYAWHRGTIRCLIRCAALDLARAAAERAEAAFPDSHWLKCLTTGIAPGYGLLDMAGDGVIDYSQLNSLSRETEGLAR